LRITSYIPVELPALAAMKSHTYVFKRQTQLLFQIRDLTEHMKNVGLYTGFCASLAKPCASKAYFCQIWV